MNQDEIKHANCSVCRRHFETTSKSAWPTCPQCRRAEKLDEELITRRGEPRGWRGYVP